MKKCCVRLKENHRLTPTEAEQVKEMELPTPEERWPFNSDEDVQLSNVEVYIVGSEEQCQDFINNIEGNNLKTQFEIIKL